MTYELKPRTPQGERFVTAAESVIESLRERADDADRASAIDADNFADMRTAGITAAFVPEECGGLGLKSIHDWMAGMTRLGRGDGSAAIAMNMHLAVTRGMTLAWHGARASGNSALAKQMEDQFAQIVAGDIYVCATATEPGTDNLHPYTEATRVDGGWCINGTKIFVTGSPIASHVAMNLRVRGEGEGGADLIGSIMLPLDTEGVIPQDDWQAMGMRASGSQSIAFDNVMVPEHMVRPMGQIADDFLAKLQGKQPSMEEGHEFLKDHQSMKWVVNRNAIDIVSKAMDIAGGGGFMDKNPLSRLYRDVRAGPFMQPYSPTEAREYIGKVTLGIYPVD